MDRVYIMHFAQRTHMEIALPLVKEREGNLELEDEVSYDKSNLVAREVEVTAGGVGGGVGWRQLVAVSRLMV
jgi:hypothetical protein